MYVTANVLLDEQHDAVVLPAAAIVREGRQPLCCIVKDGKIARVKLELGLTSGDEVEVRSA